MEKPRKQLTNEQKQRKLEYDREYYRIHKNQKLETKKAWVHANPEKRKEQNKRYYEKLKARKALAITVKQEK